MSLEDMTLTEVHCFECAKPISSIPPWLAGASVKFQCEECRQKHPRVPGMAELEPRRAASDVDELGDLAEVVEDGEEETDEDAADESDDVVE
jgi:hypothetical protein